MSIFAELAVMILDLMQFVVQLYVYVFFGAVIISWVNADPYNPIVRFIHNLTEPVMAPVRRKMWKLTYRTQLDFSPMIVIFGLFVVQMLLRRLRAMLAYGLG